jgi:hypothetical protein
VSVPIESRYKSVHSAEEFRPSHFKPLRDFTRITRHIVGQVAHGMRTGGPGVVATYRRIRANPPLIHDPTGEFSAVLAPAAGRGLGG